MSTSTTVDRRGGTKVEGESGHCDKECKQRSEVWPHPNRKKTTNRNLRSRKDNGGSRAGGIGTGVEVLSERITISRRQWKNNFEVIL